MVEVAVYVAVATSHDRSVVCISAFVVSMVVMAPRAHFVLPEGFCLLEGNPLFVFEPDD